ncbi:malonyl-CoA decarboxylase [Sulfitobacter mediterraneus]|uniref:malonyl-CoA decarboxylase n=1 Tax=Sulfitobacter mediterraneus TaxID=83219 RepID=UPI0021A74662|nr:malonyl-CoA decarboxylase [Sulfitobacter mediterraneus]UWR11994.1 malonyl-CoA decarboxylase [Sulfitobacter mediterraneus]
MSYLSGLFSTVFERRFARAVSTDAEGRDITDLANDLLGAQGEVSGSTLARLILDQYAKADAERKKAFFEFLLRDLEIDPVEVVETLKDYKASPSKRSYLAYAKASEPKRQELLRRLNQVRGGTQRLVSMRRDLLGMMREDAKLEPLDVDFQHLFASWFNRGFLVLRRINWSSPAEILEKIIAYEAVHAIDSWDDLRLRLQPTDRRCFGFFHPAMPDEPLIFVEVALTQGIPNSVQNLLANGRAPIEAEEADTAVFYSISNCQAGLAGISFGNSLIKQVAADLARDLGALDTFVTLSPIPGLTKWLGKNQSPTVNNASVEAQAAHYLIAAKREDNLPLDPVARFHLGNGAAVHAVHANADISDKGMRQSKGAMVNYLYDLAHVTANHEHFVTEKVVAASPAVHTLSASISSKS